MMKRVYAISQLGDADQRQVHLLGKRVRRVMRLEIGRDGRVVGGRVREGGGHQATSQRQRGSAGRSQFRGDRRILVGTGGDRDEGVVFGGGAHQAWTADVDLLDRLRHRGPGAGYCRRERVEIDDHQFKRADAMLGDPRHIVGPVEAAEQAAEDFGMERLEPPVHHFRETGVGGDVGDR